MLMYFVSMSMSEWDSVFAVVTGIVEIPQPTEITMLTPFFFAAVRISSSLF